FKEGIRPRLGNQMLIISLDRFALMKFDSIPDVLERPAAISVKMVFAKPDDGNFLAGASHEYSCEERSRGTNAPAKLGSGGASGRVLDGGASAGLASLNCRYLFCSPFGISPSDLTRSQHLRFFDRVVPIL